MYITEKHTFLKTIGNIDYNLVDLCETVLIKTVLFGSNSFDTNANTNALNATIECVLSTKGFDEQFFNKVIKIFEQGYESINSVFIVVVACIICRLLLFS